MPLDVVYQFGDNEVEDGNYSTTPGAYPKVARCLICEYTEIDGVPFGNRMYTELARAGDSPTNRELVKRYCEAAIKPLVDSGEIRDVVVTVDDPVSGDGLGIQVSFFDSAAGTTATVATMPPWARV